MKKFKVQKDYLCSVCKSPLVEEFSVEIMDPPRRPPGTFVMRPPSNSLAYASMRTRAEEAHRDRIENWDLESHGVSCSSCGLTYKKESRKRFLNGVRKRLEFLSYEVEGVTLTVLEKEEPPKMPEFFSHLAKHPKTGKWITTKKKEVFSGILWIVNPFLEMNFHEARGFLFVTKDMTKTPDQGFLISKKALKGIPFREKKMINLPEEAKEKPKKKAA